MEHRTKKDFALTRIRELIIAGELDPGAKLKQGELAERLQISLTPLREALRQLEAEGVVAAIAHRGVRVSSTDESTLRDVYIVRRLLEPFAAARGTSNLKPSDYRTASDLLRKLERASARGNARGIRKANYDFHFLLYERANLPLLEQLLRTLWARYPWDVLTAVPNRMDSSRDEHTEILRGIEAGDPQQVARAYEHHLKQSYADIASFLSPHQPVVDPYEVAGTAGLAFAAVLGPNRI